MKRKMRSLALWFVILSVVSILSSAAVLFLSHGEAFSRLFFSDVRDTGMDFFNSIEYVRGRMPYEQYSTLYPPLANLFFYVLIRFVPRSQSDLWPSDFSGSVTVRGTDIDLRTWQPTMLLFILFIILSAAAILYYARKRLGKKRGVNADLFAFCVLFSYGVLNAFERGNVVIVAFLCCLYFVRHQRERSRWKEALALFMLAAAAGIKLYPAFLGMMLIYDREYKKAALAVAAGIAAFVLPAFAFHEGLHGLALFLEQLSDHSAEMAESQIGFSFDRICRTVMNLITPAGSEAEGSFLLPSALSWLSLVAVGFVLLSGFLMEKRWQKLLACCVAMLMYSYQYSYATVFFLIPLIELIREEKRLTWGNALIFLALVLSVVWLPIMDEAGWPVSLVYGRFQVCMILFVLYLAVQAVMGALRRRRNEQCDVPDAA